MEALETKRPRRRRRLFKTQPTREDIIRYGRMSHEEIRAACADVDESERRYIRECLAEGLTWQGTDRGEAA